MNAGRGSDGQDDVDARFAEMIAELERDGFGGDDDGDYGASTGKPSSDFGPNAQDHRVTDEQRGGVPDQAVWRGSTSEWDPTFAELDKVGQAGQEDDHFVPPEPPPLPKPRPGTVIALVLLALGLVLLVVPSLIGIPARIGTPLALVCLASGLGMLLLRMRSGPPSDDTDDGAQV